MERDNNNPANDSNKQDRHQAPEPDADHYEVEQEESDEFDIDEVLAKAGISIEDDYIIAEPFYALVTRWNAVFKNPFFKYVMRWRWSAVLNHPIVLTILTSFFAVFLFKISVDHVFPYVIPFLLITQNFILIFWALTMFAFYIGACMIGYSLQFVVCRGELRELARTGRLEQFLTSGQTIPVVFGLTFPYVFSAQMMGFGILLFHCAFFVREIDVLIVYLAVGAYAGWIMKRNGSIVGGEDIRLAFGYLGEPAYIRGILGGAMLYFAGWLTFIVPYLIIILVLPAFFTYPPWLQSHGMQLLLAIVAAFWLQKFVLTPILMRTKNRLREKWGNMRTMIYTTMENAAAWGQR